MNRITGLVKLIHSDIDSLKPLAPLQSEGVRAGILRTIIVFLHATLRMFCARLVLLFCFQLPYMGLSQLIFSSPIFTSVTLTSPLRGTSWASQVLWCF